MALGEIKMKRSSKTGFLFFLLLQMSLLSKVWPNDPVTEATTESARTTDQTTNPGSTSSPTSIDQMSSISTSSTTTSTSSVNSTGSTVIMTSMNTGMNYSMVSCPAFVCTTDCSVQLMNATVNPCPSSSSFCEVMKQNTSYSVSCSASCGMSCGNTTTVNCSWKCCNTTNCINDTVLALNNLVSTTVATTSIATTTTTKATVPVTQANNGKKCHNIKCDGAACYKPSNTVMLCPVGQDYCMLKKTTTGSTESWLGGCSDDCRKMAVCSASVTTCYLECCNATSSASCLKLTGDVNMPSSATRGPHSPALLMASLLLFWIVRVFT